MQILTTQAELRNARHVTGQGLGWQCTQCGKVEELGAHDGLGTGYGYDERDRPICYACCGDNDRARMVETGRACLYLICDAERPRPRPRAGSWDSAPYRVTNGPASLVFKTHGARIGRHNFAGRRYDVWFTGPDGLLWHGVTYGDNTQVCHVKRTKASA